MRTSDENNRWEQLMGVDQGAGGENFADRERKKGEDIFMTLGI